MLVYKTIIIENICYYNSYHIEKFRTGVVYVILSNVKNVLYTINFKKYLT